MSSRLVAVTFESPDPTTLATYWAALLGRRVDWQDPGPLLTGEPGQVGLRFVESTRPRTVPNRFHLHLTSDSAEDERRIVDEAVELGGRHVDVGQLPEEDHTVLADPAGDEFCVIGPDNGFLAGCGRLGEVSCDGSRNVGLFWRDALDWPLVWDENEETAVQSPVGGTKVSWGGPPLAPKDGPNRQRLELATADVDAEIERLLALGATRLGTSHQTARGVELADPDGNELLLVRP